MRKLSILSYHLIKHNQQMDVILKYLHPIFSNSEMFSDMMILIIRILSNYLIIKVFICFKKNLIRL